MAKLGFSRRRFLHGLGISAAAVPFVVGLESLYPRAAAAAVPKKRFVYMYSPYTSLYYNWRLRLPGTDVDISDGSALAAPNLVLNPLRANASKLLLLDRVSLVGAREAYQNASVSPDHIDHPGGEQKAMGNLLTGQVLTGGTSDFGNAGLANGMSVDQVLATQVFNGLVKFPSLEVGVQVDENLTDRYVEKRVSYDGPGQPRSPINDPFALFHSVFGNPGTTTPGYRSYVDKSSLDAVLGDFARLQPKLSQADQRLLEQHSDAIRNLEKQLATLTNCGSPTAPIAASVDPSDPVATHKWAMTASNLPAVGEAMSDIIVQALACGLTNVVTWMWTNAESNLQYDFLPPLAAKQEGANELAHARDPSLLYVGQWYAAQLASFIGKLDALPDSETSGSLLDNSVVMWSSELGDDSSHLPNNVPITLAGSNGGYFRTGRSVRFDDVWTPAEWAGDPLSPTDPNALAAFDAVRTGDQLTIGQNDRSNSDLLVSILNSFGLETETFGDPRFCKGPLPGLAK
jgi:hypothetical protein